ncbi:hypothetical protein FB565_006943 [Actinoplanes lutulentus]|uniref:ABC-2 family transporter n=1 Tax=Actinoplanes lutulentus TaxID=1287878 RepID=A0A327ZB43_9ACTN|nr:hypothetical protein [Actinoplanes lutulentus]MBB2947175.1 hypothetical protein [Actinoplanes lutulentus]RAK36450.1 hypothetical protein B0I29_10839 [Actinoplanes lutulentus]
MIAVLRSELHRSLTIRSSWIALAGFATLAALTGWLSEEFWTLFAGLGAFGIAIMITAQHYQHRTAILVFLGQPHRLLVFAAQCVVSVLFALVLAAVSGVAVAGGGYGSEYLSTLAVVPLIAVFGAANATIVRHPLWLFAGYLGWLLFAEGLIGRLEEPLPFTSFLYASTGDSRFLLSLLAWTAASLPLAAWSIRRDVAAG